MVLNSRHDGSSPIETLAARRALASRTLITQGQDAGQSNRSRSCERTAAVERRHTVHYRLVAATRKSARYVYTCTAGQTRGHQFIMHSNEDKTLNRQLPEAELSHIELRHSAGLVAKAPLATAPE